MVLNIENLIITTREQDRDFLRKAYKVAWDKSDDIRTKTGALIVRDNNFWINGYNHFVKGTENITSRHDATEKVHYTVHAEEHAICNAAKDDFNTKGAIMFMPWIPCTSCYRMIISSGIDKLVVHKEMIMRSPEKWIENLNKTLYMADMAKFQIEMYSGKIGDVKAMIAGEEWNP